MEKMSRNWEACESVFKEIDGRQITALMFHDQMADFFDFLGLMGFKRMHEYQYFAESAEHRATKRYFLNHHNKLLMSGSISDPKAVPDTWYKYTRFDVNPQIRKQAVQDALDSYQRWETETKEFYENCAKTLIDNGYIADAQRVMQLIEDVDMELKCLDRLIITLKSVSYNDVYIATIQDEMHEKYKNKTDDIGINIC